MYSTPTESRVLASSHCNLRFIKGDNYIPVRKKERQLLTIYSICLGYLMCIIFVLSVVVLNFVNVKQSFDGAVQICGFFWSG